MANQSEKNESGNVVIYVILVVVLIAAIGLDFWSIKHKKAKVALATSSSTKAGNLKNSTSSSTATDNQTLNSDLTNVNSAITQSQQDSTSAANAINDSSQQITVPQN